MILAVASGKGGTGKTTVAVNMARVFGSPVRLVDCDVEEPNGHLFLKGTLCGREPFTVPVVVVDASLCDGCGECVRFCRSHAMAMPGAVPLVFPELCRGCGGCALVCPRRAISEGLRSIGVIETLQSDNVTLVRGRLDVGEARSTPLIRGVKARLGNGSPAILDAPPGTSCPVIAALRGTDAVVLVTEPTPFGLNDLELAVEAVRELGMPFGVVINRIGTGDDRVHAFCRRQDIPVLLEIPDDRRIAEAYARGALIVEALPEYRGCFKKLIEKAMNLPGHRGNEPCRPTNTNARRAH